MREVFKTSDVSPMLPFRALLPRVRATCEGVPDAPMASTCTTGLASQCALKSPNRLGAVIMAGSAGPDCVTSTRGVSVNSQLETLYHPNTWPPGNFLETVIIQNGWPHFLRITNIIPAPSTSGYCGQLFWLHQGAVWVHQAFYYESLFILRVPVNRDAEVAKLLRT